MSPRAGHSGAVLGDIWYIVGGGNNVKGCADLLAADLAALPTSNTLTWHVVTSVRECARRGSLCVTVWKVRGGVQRCEEPWAGGCCGHPAAACRMCLRRP